MILSHVIDVKKVAVLYCIAAVAVCGFFIQQPLQYLIYIWDSSNQQLAGYIPCTIYKNPVNALAPFGVLVAQLVEHPPGVWKVMGSNPIGNRIFFFRVYVCFNYSLKTCIDLYCIVFISLC